MNVLVLAAHPDDEVLGCGGTIARLAEEGHRVEIVIFGEGITSRYKNRDDADQGLIDDLHARSRKVAERLGAHDLFLHSLPDNRFDSVDLLDIVKLVEGHIERLRPEVVYTQHGGDLNVDHVQLFRATLTATRPLPGCPVKRVYAYEVASSSEWALGQFSPVFRPNVFCDIGEFLEIKIAAMQLYESEARVSPHPRSPESLRAMARHRGSMVGLPAAEAFVLVREIQGEE